MKEQLYKSFVKSFVKLKPANPQKSGKKSMLACDHRNLIRHPWGVGGGILLTSLELGVSIYREAVGGICFCICTRSNGVKSTRVNRRERVADCWVFLRGCAVCVGGFYTHD